MKFLIMAVVIALSGCSSLTGPPDASIPPNRLYWPSHVDRAVPHNGNVYIIRGR